MIARELARPDRDDDDPPSNGKSSENEEPFSQENKIKNAGKLILDATCVPADIHYPTDIWLLNEVREALEEIIDVLHVPQIGNCVKPRTYRNCARKAYLNVEKKKKLTFITQ